MRKLLLIVGFAPLLCAQIPTITTLILPNGTVGTAYGQTLGVLLGTPPYAWSVSAGALPDGLTLSSPQGRIAGTPTAFGTFNFTAKVTDSSNASGTRALTIVVNPAALDISTTTLPNATVLVPYSQTLAATGGTGGYTWTVSAGTLPSGLTLSSAGAITGTPTAAVNSNFTARVADNSGQTTTQALSLKVVVAALVVTTASLPAGTSGTAYSQTLAASGGTGGYAWTVSAGALPAGLALSAAGAITGTPTTAGTTNFTVQVKDSANTTATKALSIAIAPPPLVISTASLPNGVSGTAYSQTLAATGGAGGNIWSVTVGTLPAGLSLSAAGAITGTPTTAGASNFTVQVKDSANTTATKALTITIAPPPLTITTASLPDGVSGTAYSQTLAASGGAGGNTWSVTVGTLPAGLSLSAAGAITGTPTTAGASNFTVQVKDSANTTAIKALTITIAPPPLTITTASLPDGVSGTAYSQTLAASGGAGGNTWSIATGTLPAGLSLSAAGAIAGTPTTAGASNFTVQVKDSANTTVTKALTITIAPPPLTITTASLPDGVSGTAYSQTLAASGGVGGNTWSVTVGALPAGLSLSAAGAITGTPTTAGASNFTVQVKDSANTTVTKALTITIAPPALTITTTSLPDGVSGTAYSQTLAASGGAGGNTWSITVGVLPAGLSLSAAGAITGTPTAAGTNSFTVQVKDSANTTVTKALTITVAPPQLTVTTATLPNGVSGTAYSQTLVASGGAGGNTWSVTVGTLPAGLSLSAAGAITGTPTTAGTSNFTVQVKDAANTTATKALTITIAPPQLTITTASLPDGVSGTAYSQTLAASGGAGGNTWSIATGTLPAGLSLSAAGAITGTPTAAGTSNFSVQVKDAANTTTTKALAITIAPPQLTITTASLPDGVSGTAYSQTLAASGGVGGNTWSVTVGTLPAGLSLSAAGAITGTPTAAGTSNFTVQVKDSANTIATKALTITIASPALSVSTASLPNGVSGTAYSQLLAASGGAGGNTWSVTVGTLPAGLSLSTAGAITGTPTTPGTSNFTVQVKDSANATAVKALAITIAASSLVISTTSLPNAAQGAGYSQLLAATGGSGGYRWSITSGALPAGLSLDPSGRIAGTPSGSTSSFTVQVADGTGLTATRTLSIIVAPAISFSTSAALPGAVVGGVYSSTIVAIGGTPPYSFAVVSGQLPDGIDLNASSGALAGTPTLAGSYSFSLRVTDSAGASATAPFGLNVRPPLAITTAQTLANGSVGALYRQLLAVTGGVPPYSWSVVAGPLPNGISLNPGSGELSGTPSQAGTFPITVQVRDSANAQIQARLTLSIVNGLTITTPPVLPPANVGVAYQLALDSAGGAAPYIWSVTAGSLPPGLAFHSDGKIDGTPTTGGSFTFTALVVDANSSRATKDFTLAVALALSITSPTVLPDGVTGAPYTLTLAAAGGTPPYSFTVSAGSAPTGLMLEAPTGTLAGIPSSAGAFRFTVTLTDAASLTSQKEFTLTISPGLTFTNPAALPGAVAGTAYNFTLQASGGQPPYSYRISSGALPDGLSLNSSSGVVSGIPAAAGTFNFTVEVTDGARLTVSRVHSLVVTLPSAPTLTLSSVPASLDTLQQPTVDLTVGDAYPVAVTGRLNLRFTPANNMPDDPSVQFSTGGRTVTFTIPANATHAVFPAPQFAIQTGSVAGSIDFLVESLDAGGTSLPAPAAPLRTVQIAAAPPVVRSIAVNRTGSGFEVAIVALSDTRELKQATVRFHPSAGSNLQTSEVTIPLTDGAAAWFSSGGSAAYGGQFTLTLPFSIVGGAAGVLDSVAVILTNTVGSSAESSAPVV